MRVERKNLFHKILRPILNWWGGIQGYSGCGICGDRWSWKEGHTIKMTETQGAFPICEECWKTKSDYLIRTAVNELGRVWVLQTSYLKDTIQEIKLLKKQTEVALKTRRVEK